MLKDGVNGVDGLDGACSVTLSSDGNHAYVTGWDDDAVSWYERNGSTGALSYLGMLKDGVNGVDGLDGVQCDLFIGRKSRVCHGLYDDAVSWYYRNEHGSIELWRDVKGRCEWSGWLGWCPKYDPFIGRNSRICRGGF